MRRLAQDIERLKSSYRHRSLNLPAGIDFTSNDYLGLSRHPALRAAIVETLDEGVAVGAGASRLLRGHHPPHAELEAFAANFFGAEGCLYFSTGFLANFALFTTLPDRRDAVVVDERVHASVKDGIHAGHARIFKVPHNDVDAFEGAIQRARESGAQDIWIAIESVYSMDGDYGPVVALHELAHRYDATLIVDEAHASGIYGPTGRGLAEGRYDDRLITLHTCGKALGVSGGLVCGPAVVIDYLINFARPFIYSTATPPYIAAAVKRALTLVDEEPWRRDRLHHLSALAHREIFRSTGAPSNDQHRTQIIPFILGSDERAMTVAAALRENGFDIRAIRPPTVAAGTSRLRISISADRTEEEIVALADAIASVSPRIAAE